MKNFLELFKNISFKKNIPSHTAYTQTFEDCRDLLIAVNHQNLEIIKFLLNKGTSPYFIFSFKENRTYYKHDASRADYVGRYGDWRETHPNFNNYTSPIIEAARLNNDNGDKFFELILKSSTAFKNNDLFVGYEFDDSVRKQFMNVAFFDPILIICENKNINLFKLYLLAFEDPVSHPEKLFINKDNKLIKNSILHKDVSVSLIENLISDWPEAQSLYKERFSQHFKKMKDEFIPSKALVLAAKIKTIILENNLPGEINAALTDIETKIIQIKDNESLINYEHIIVQDLPRLLSGAKITNDYSYLLSAVGNINASLNTALLENKETAIKNMQVINKKINKILN